MRTLIAAKNRSLQKENKYTFIAIACEYSRLSFVFRSSLRDANERRLYSQAIIAKASEILGLDQKFPRTTIFQASLM